MAKPPKGMHIFTVLPQYYDQIIEASKNSPEPYTRPQLEIMRSNAQERNSVALVMFMDPEFWNAEFHSEPMKLIPNEEQS